MEIEDNSLDSFFRKKTLAGDEPGYDEHAWDLMERKLNKRDRLIFYKRVSVALLLLCFVGFGTYFLKGNYALVGVNQLSKNEKTNLNKELNQKDNRIKEKTQKKDLNKDRIELLVEKKNQKIIASTEKSILVIKKQINFNDKNQTEKTHQNYSSSSLKTDYLNEKISSNNVIDESQNIKSNGNTKKEEIYSDLVSKSTTEEIAKTEINKEEPISVEAKKLMLATNEPEIKPTLFSKTLSKEKIKTSPNKRDGIKWGLSFSLGPENNTVDGLGSGKTTINGGILVQAGFKEKWRLSSGFVYGVKNYNASRQQYNFSYTPKYQIDNIIASCNVLEIPMRLSYQVASQKKGAFYINGGLSSFLMIKEQYTWQYNASTSQPDRTITKNNANQDFLSVLELSTTYQFKLKGKFNLGISPYVKLPLGGIGEGKVRLKSTGINLNYNYDFVKKKK